MAKTRKRPKKGRLPTPKEAARTLRSLPPEVREPLAFYVLARAAGVPSADALRWSRRIGEEARRRREAESSVESLMVYR